MPKTQTETNEAAARKARVVRTLDVIESRFAFADASGSLAKRLRDVVQHNPQKAARAGPYGDEKQLEEAKAFGASDCP